MVLTLPNSRSPSLVLAQPTADEQHRTWVQTQPFWGPSYSIDAYLAREQHLLSVPLARDGGITQWILTTITVAHGISNPRPVLATCETLRKPALVRDPDGTVRNVWAHGIASVFTYPELRRRGYANQMLSLIGKHLSQREARSPGEAAASVLFSDIGTSYYAALGWLPFESTHLEFPVAQQPRANGPSGCPDVRQIVADDLPALAMRDVELLRRRIALPPADATKTRFAIAPTLEALQWHFAREAFMSKDLFSAVPPVHGAIYTPPASPNARVWALWVRTQHGGKYEPDKNVVEFIRFVIEDEDAIDDAQLASAMSSIVHEAQAEARQWLCSKIAMWNPSPRIRAIVKGIKDLESTFLVRERYSVPSLRSFLQGVSASDIEWVANEKFEWC